MQGPWNIINQFASMMMQGANRDAQSGDRALMQAYNTALQRQNMGITQGHNLERMGVANNYKMQNDTIAHGRQVGRENSARAHSTGMQEDRQRHAFELRDADHRLENLRFNRNRRYKVADRDEQRQYDRSLVEEDRAYKEELNKKIAASTTEAEKLKHQRELEKIDARAAARAQNKKPGVSTGMFGENGQATPKAGATNPMPSRSEAIAAQNAQDRKATANKTGGFHAGSMQSAIYQGLVSRGAPDHVARGIMRNLKDESGFRTDINERNPIVPGSRGGFGLMQWTGPRRRQLEAYARSVGKPVSDLDTQLDFMFKEFGSTEKSSYQKMLATNNENDAAIMFLKKNLRPAAAHQASRGRRYAGGRTSADNPVYFDDNSVGRMSDIKDYMVNGPQQETGLDQYAQYMGANPNEIFQNAPAVAAQPVSATPDTYTDQQQADATAGKPMEDLQSDSARDQAVAAMMDNGIPDFYAKHFANQGLMAVGRQKMSQDHYESLDEEGKSNFLPDPENRGYVLVMKRIEAESVRPERVSPGPSPADYDGSEWTLENGTKIKLDG